MNQLSVHSMTRLLTQPYRRGAETLAIPLGADIDGWTSVAPYEFKEYRARYQEDPPDPKYIIFPKQDIGRDGLEIEISFSGVTQTTLSNTINAVTTTLQVDAIAGFSLKLPFPIRINDELITVSAIDPIDMTLWTVTRAVAGTVAVAHNQGAVVVQTYLLTIPPNTFAGTSFALSSLPIPKIALTVLRFRQLPFPLPGSGEQNWGIIALLGNIAKLVWVMGWEKDQIRRQMQEIRRQRCRQFAYGFSLDTLGNDLRVPRFPAREYSFDENALALYHLNDPDNTTDVEDATVRFRPSSTGHPGTRIGNVQSGVLGKFGKGFKFPGTIEIANHPDFDILGDRSFTVEAFVKTDVIASAFLTAAVDATTTTLQVTSNFGFPSNPPFSIFIDDEEMRVSAMTANTWTVTRGAGTTIATSHVKGASVTKILPASIIAKGQQDTAGRLTSAGWSLLLGSFRGIDNNVQWTLSDGSNRFTLFADINIGDDQFHHLAGILDRNNQRTRLFVDGEERATSLISGLSTIINSEPIRLGRSTNGNPFFGVIDEVRLSKIARSDFHPVLGEGDAQYRQRLGIFERWQLPTPDALLNTINSLVSINSQSDSFILIEKDPPGATVSKLVRILPAILAAGQSIDREGSSYSEESELYGEANQELDFDKIYLLRHDSPNVNYGTNEDNRRLQAVTQQVLDALVDLLATSTETGNPITGNLVIDKSFAPNDTKLHHVGRALLLHHDSLPPERLGVYAYQAGFDFVQNTEGKIYASVAPGEKLEILIEPAAFLAAAINSTTTILNVTLTNAPSRPGFLLNPPFRIQIEQEVMGVINVTATTWTVTRTTGSAVPHASSAAITLVDTDLFIDQALNLSFLPENLPRNGQIQWTIIRCGSGEATLQEHPGDPVPSPPARPTPVRSRPRLSLVADAPGEITVRVEYTLNRRTVTGTKTFRIGIESLSDGEAIAANGDLNISEAEVVGKPEGLFNPIYLINHNVAGVDYGTNADNHRMQIVLEQSLNRLLGLLAGLGGSLQIQKAYDPGDSGLHNEGRALRLQHSTLSAEKLGTLAHQAGFDFVQRQSNDIYCSVATGEKIEIVRASDLTPLGDELNVGSQIDLRVRFAELPLGLLFNIDITFGSDLDSGTISDALRQAFRNQGVFLSQNASLTIETAGNQWRVTDLGRTYTVRNETGQLNVYSSSRGYNWSLTNLGNGRGSFNAVLRPEVTFTPLEPGLLGLNVTYLERDPQSTPPYTFEIRLKPALDLPETIILKEEYDLIMNILNYFHPIGVEAITQNIRDHVVEVKGDLLQGFPGYTYPDFRL